MKRKTTKSRTMKVNKTTKPKTKTQSRPKSKLRNTRQKASRNNDKRNRSAINKKAKSKSNQKRKASKRQESAYKVKYYKRARHLHIIVEDIDKDAYKSIGLTHSDKNGKHKNLPLQSKTTEGDNKQTYIRHKPTIDYKQRYEKSKRRHIIDKKDIPTIKKVAARKPQDMRKKK